jgi:hypothetical protein
MPLASFQIYPGSILTFFIILLCPYSVCLGLDTQAVASEPMLLLWLHLDYCLQVSYLMNQLKGLIPVSFFPYTLFRVRFRIQVSILFIILYFYLCDSFTAEVLRLNDWFLRKLTKPLGDYSQDEWMRQKDMGVWEKELRFSWISFPL